MNIKNLSVEEIEALGAVTIRELFRTRDPKEKKELKQYLLELTLELIERKRGTRNGTE